MAKEKKERRERLILSFLFRSFLLFSCAAHPERLRETLLLPIYKLQKRKRKRMEIPLVYRKCKEEEEESPAL
jgi:hypothetical protein